MGGDGRDDGEHTLIDDTEVGSRGSVVTLLCELLHSDMERKNVASAVIQAERLLAEMNKGAVAIPGPLVHKTARALLALANETTDPRWLTGYYDLVSQSGVTPDPQTALRARDIAQKLKR